MYHKTDLIHLAELPFAAKELPIGGKKIVNAYLESPGVYRLCVAPEHTFMPPPELLVVTADAPAISVQARSYGEIPCGRPDLTVFRCGKHRGGQEIVEFEIFRYLTKAGVKLPEGRSLRSMAYCAMELYPEYFGPLPAPMQTPWGSMVRCFELAHGVFWMETDRCRELLAVASPIHEADLSEEATALGKMVGRDEMGYLFFSRRASCVPLFELLPLHREWETGHLIDKPALMNALLRYHSGYAEEHNKRERKIIRIVNHSNEDPTGISNGTKIRIDDMIYPTEGTGTNCFLFLDKWGRDGSAPVLEPDLSVLTEKQHTAYSLRMQGLSYKKIAEEMGITASAANQLIRHAERRLREFQQHQRLHRQNQMPVAFPLTREELLLIRAGLDLLEENLKKRVIWRADTDWEGRLPYQFQLVEALHKRAKAVLYGK